MDLRTGTELAALLSDVGALLARADALAAAAGVRLVAAGTNPYHSPEQVPLRTPTPRYRALQRVLDEGGPDGRRMMRLTAALQICVDILPGVAGREQWLVANRRDALDLLLPHADLPWAWDQAADGWSPTAADLLAIAAAAQPAVAAALTGGAR